MAAGSVDGSSVMAKTTPKDPLPMTLVSLYDISRAPPIAFPGWATTVVTFSPAGPTETTTPVSEDGSTSPVEVACWSANDVVRRRLPWSVLVAMLVLNGSSAEFG